MSSSASWIATQLDKCDFVRAAESDGNRVTVARIGRPTVSIGVLSVKDVRLADVLPLVEGDGRVDFVLNVPKNGRFMGDALTRLAEDHIGWGGLGDAIRALRDFDILGDYEERELTFVMRGLRQHRQVTELAILDDRKLRVSRHGLPDLVIFIGSMYQPTAESVREAVDRYGKFDMFAATNPNSDPTMEAIQAATNAGVRLLQWGPTLATLHE
ncbi:hypothetical protein [Prescottella equi]|uniref:hypothetical protein n=1 Tax=Rhodococcus hoagii TaxID=43767 RepID=UPI0011A7141F|nr:hypothetical protein [Prescottella equi]